jgi:hypothetical protein
MRPVSILPPMDWPPEVRSKSANLLSDLHGLTLVVVAGACLTGMLLASLVQLPSVSLLIGGIPALIAMPFLWNDTRARIILLIILSLLIGAWRYTIASPVGDPQAISAFIGKGKV